MIHGEPNSRQYTWRQHSPLKQSRIDYFLISEDLFSLIKDTDIKPGYRTDHSAISFTFSVSLAKRGRGYWKFNAQLLHDLDYIAVVKKCIHDAILEYNNSGNITDLINIELSCNDQMFEILKMKIRSLTINYSINKSKQEKSDMKKLEQEIQDLENAFVHNPVEQIKNKLNDKKNMQIRQR